LKDCKKKPELLSAEWIRQTFAVVYSQDWRRDGRHILA